MEDYEIASQVKLESIEKIAQNLGLSNDEIELYGKYKAKISNYQEYATLKNNQEKLILVTAINPTPAGEGKTTTSVGLNDALNRIGKKSIVVLREPSLGPVFGVKGGAAGGGYSQVAPMEDINLHFTGDFHAITSANNLLCALLDNHIKQGNELDIDINSITLKRVVDMNDRQLRFIEDGLPAPTTPEGSTANGIPRKDGFDITVASEIMAIFCLSNNLKDLKDKLSKIVVAYSNPINGKAQAITAGDLKATGALAALLKDALKPNLVQSLEHNPAIIHGGPFANIAHGCNSIIATKTALGIVGKSTSPDGSKSGYKGGYVVTEAGFGADLGAEKFIDIKCRLSGIYPNVAVVVATIRALKSHGGVAKEDLNFENLDALQKGMPNLLQHLQNLKDIYQLPVVVAINKFKTDTEKEIQLLKEEVEKTGTKAIFSDVWAKGGEGGIELAEEVVKLAEQSNQSGKQDQNNFSYNLEQPIVKKAQDIAQKIYHADDVEFSDLAKSQIETIEKNGFGNLPICVAKTQYSFSDDPKLLGAPRDFKIHITSAKLNAGAGFVVLISGSIMTMPGLPKVPSAEKIDVTDDGKIIGVF